ncbi:MAG: hypothetical protein JNK14_00185 [Chitinophagaceae bacterium]|nr:hypothetical protein [Chitinophagaceae bacterium]
MKKLLFISLILLIVNSAFTQVTYTFTGTGNWTDTANWENGFVPPGVLLPGSTIIINPAGNGECVLNKPQTITYGATFILQPDKKLKITGSLFMAPVIPLYKLHGLGFSPYYDGQNPGFQSQISEQQIAYLIQRVALYTNWIRSYGSTHGLEKIGVNAHRQDLKVAAGAWLDSNMANNQTEIANLISMGLAGEIDVAVVGSEVLLRGDLTKSQLIGYITQVKAALPNIPVTTADIYQTFLSHPDLVSAVDVLYVHIYPFWERKSINCATYLIDKVYTNLQTISQGKEIVVAETGWPSEGESEGLAVPSPVNASTFFLHFTSWAKTKQVKYFYFEAFDETWKGTTREGLRGAHWGIWEKNAGVLKPGMDSVFNGVTISDNWILDTAAILADTPSIAFTFVPPLGVQQDVQGIVKGVLPFDYKVAVYIYANCGWYPKPTYAEPFTLLQCDGSFICHINDIYETILRAYLLPVSFNPGGNSIPIEVAEQNAIAMTEVLRPATFVANLITYDANNITQTTAESGGNITCDGGAAITARGVCWNTTGDPNITADLKTSDGSGIGFFYSNITGLNPNTTYYVKAYATNSAGTAYGSEKIFTTASALPPHRHIKKVLIE